jgi:hypothetical protein
MPGKRDPGRADANRKPLDFEQRRKDWPGLVEPICRDLATSVERLRAASTHANDGQFSGLVSEVGSSVQCLTEMVNVMALATAPAAQLDEAEAERIRASWRESIHADFDDLCVNVAKLGKLAQRIRDPQLSSCVKILVRSVDRLGDMLSVKFFLNGDSVREVEKGKGKDEQAKGT